MNTVSKTLLAVITTALCATSAQASFKSAVDAITFHVGAKAGQVKSNAEKFDSEKPISLGANLGVTGPQHVGLELDYLVSDKKEGKLGNYKTQVIGAYGTYTLPLIRGLYAKGKLGYAKTEVTVNDNKDAKIKNDGFAGGLGLGYHISPKFAIEGEYSKLNLEKSGDEAPNSDLITIGARYQF